MTKTEKLEKKVAELEAKLEAAGVKLEPSKMDEILEMETATIDRIRCLVTECESKTGRTLQHRTLPDCVEEVMCIDPRDTLKEGMRDLGKRLRDQYSFDTVTNFCRWAKPYIREGYNAKRKKKY